MQNISSYARTMWYLFITDVRVLLPQLSAKIIDLTIWLTIIGFVTKYLMPAFGVSSGYVSLQIVGLCASAGIFETYSSLITTIGDLDGARTINYYLTLPLPSWMLILRYAIKFTMHSLVASSIVLPLMFCFLGYNFVTSISLVQFLLMFISMNIFYGCFTIFIITLVKNIQYVGTAWTRVIFPMWYLGGFTFTWAVVYRQVPALGYVNLANPINYIFEGIRGSVLGQAGYINIWLCIAVTMACALVSFIVGYYRLKRRLDFI